jgi:cell division protein FtsL
MTPSRKYFENLVKTLTEQISAKQNELLELEAILGNLLKREAQLKVQKQAITNKLAQLGQMFNSVCTQFMTAAQCNAVRNPISNQISTYQLQLIAVNNNLTEIGSQINANKEKQDTVKAEINNLSMRKRSAEAALARQGLQITVRPPQEFFESGVDETAASSLSKPYGVDETEDLKRGAPQEVIDEQQRLSEEAAQIEAEAGLPKQTKNIIIGLIIAAALVTTILIIRRVRKKR